MKNHMKNFKNSHASVYALELFGRGFTPACAADVRQIIEDLRKMIVSFHYMENVMKHFIALEYAKNENFMGMQYPVIYDEWETEK